MYRRLFVCIGEPNIFLLSSLPLDQRFTFHNFSRDFKFFIIKNIIKMGDDWASKPISMGGGEYGAPGKEEVKLD